MINCHFCLRWWHSGKSSKQKWKTKARQNEDIPLCLAAFCKPPRTGAPLNNCNRAVPKWQCSKICKKPDLILRRLKVTPHESWLRILTQRNISLECKMNTTQKLCFITNANSQGRCSVSNTKLFPIVNNYSFKIYRRQCSHCGRLAMDVWLSSF